MHAEEFGPYLVYEQLGAGAIATVHRAVKRGVDGLERTVALERLLPPLAADQRFVAGFEREAQRAAQLNHPNIAPIVDAGRIGDTSYVASELVVGVDLGHLLARLGDTIGPMPVSHVLNVLAQVCAGLDHAHHLGLIHRDVSPDNVIVGHDGVVKLVDFGIPRPANVVRKAASQYLAPEAVAGRLDEHSDLFAVGVLGYELLTGQPLRKGDTDPPPPSQLNVSVEPGVDELIMTALARDPEARWRSAARMRHEIDRVVARYGHHASNGEVHGWIEWAMRHGTGDAPAGRAPSVVFPRARTPIPEAAASGLLAARPAPAPPAPPRPATTPTSVILLVCAALLIVALVAARLLA